MSLFSYKKTAGFTIAELIVVIVILAILSTIAFISFHSYAASARNSVRVSDITNISQSFELFASRVGGYPAPDNSVSVTYSGGIIWKQGVVGDEVIAQITWGLKGGGISKKPVDPTDSSEYVYSSLETGLAYQIKANYEDSLFLGKIPQSLDIAMKNAPIAETAYADSWDSRIVRIKGNYNEIATAIRVADTVYVLTLPSIVADITENADFESLSGKLLVDGARNSEPLDYRPVVVYSSWALPGKGDDVGITDIMLLVKDAYQNSTMEQKPWVTAFLRSSTGSLPIIGRNILGFWSAGTSTSLAVGESCENGYTLVAGTCVPDDCPASTQTINAHVYDVPALNHGDISLVGFTGAIDHGYCAFEQSFICSTGSILPDGSETNTANACDSWYEYENGSCAIREQSLLFDKTGSQYLNRTPINTGNQKKWTWSGWVKLGSIPQNGTLFAARTWVGAAYTILSFRWVTANTIWLQDNQLTSLETKASFRDPSAWYHVVLAVDTAQSTSTDRVKLYVNGVQQVFQAGTYYAQNANTNVNAASVTHLIGQQAGGSYFDGYLSDVNFVDGQALDPGYFAGSDGATGQWLPKPYAWSYGTNGFSLNFQNDSNLGEDASGNGNAWTVNGGMTAAANQMIDVPTNNFAVLNPLDTKTWGTTTVYPTKGNLTYTQSAGYNALSVWSFIMTNGKWYWEININTVRAAALVTAVGACTHSATQWTGNYLGYESGEYGYINNGNKVNNDSPVAYGASYTTGDNIGIAFDADIGALTFYKNGVSQGTAYTGLTSGSIRPCMYSNGDILTANFGQWGQSGLTYDTASKGYFKYPPPTGFKSLSSANLPEPAIKKPKEYFDVVTRSWFGPTWGTYSALQFQPDMIWEKSRNTTNDHVIFDSLRWLTKGLIPNQTYTEGTWNNWFTSFNPNGFTTGTGDWTNSYNLVDWCWKAGGTDVSNTTGSIPSQISANPTAGFSIMTWTGNGVTGASIWHGLDTAPKMFMTKSRNSGTASDHWTVYHSAMDSSVPQNYAMHMDLTNARNPAIDYWNNTSPTASIITHGYNAAYINVTGRTYVTYAWSEVPGFSKFGSYTGNGNVDGPFVNTGFKPKYVMIKRSDSAGDWIIQDTARSASNPSDTTLYSNLSAAESNGGGYQIDMIANGFKIRNTATYMNTSGWTYVYAAFADAPFKYADAR